MPKPKPDDTDDTELEPADEPVLPGTQQPDNPPAQPEPKPDDGEAA